MQQDERDSRLHFTELFATLSRTRNLADCLSRGLPSHELANCELWWKDPVWISGQVILVFWTCNFRKKEDPRNKSIQFILEGFTYTNYVTAYVIRLFNSFKNIKYKSKNLTALKMKVYRNRAVQSECLIGAAALPRASKMPGLFSLSLSISLSPLPLIWKTFVR